MVAPCFVIDCKISKDIFNVKLHVDKLFFQFLNFLID
jgi:hypothetical protein